MALKIKLQRGGAVHNPIYRIVVAGRVGGEMAVLSRNWELTFLELKASRSN